MGEIVQFRSYTALDRKKHLSKDLEKEIGDIILGGAVEQTADERKEFIEHYVQDVRYIDSLYRFESGLQRLGYDLAFSMISSYSQPYITLNPANRFFSKEQFPEVMDNMLIMLEGEYKDEEDFNALTGSLLFYSITSKLFGDSESYPSYQHKIIATHEKTGVTKQIQDEFPITSKKVFKNLQHYITDEYRKILH
jgi:hypothetical protein